MQSVPWVTTGQTVCCCVPATLMPDVTHRLDTAYAPLEKLAMTVQQVCTATVCLLNYFLDKTILYQMSLTATLVALHVACESGYWGQGCDSKCQCQDGSVGCDPATGQCVCETGFTGDLCEKGKFSCESQKI